MVIKIMVGGKIKNIHMDEMNNHKSNRKAQINNKQIKSTISMKVDYVVQSKRNNELLER